jgi:hypothetical protein
LARKEAKDHPRSIILELIIQFLHVVCGFVHELCPILCSFCCFGYMSYTHEFIEIYLVLFPIYLLAFVMN